MPSNEAARCKRGRTLAFAPRWKPTSLRRIVYSARNIPKSQASTATGRKYEADFLVVAVRQEPVEAPQLVVLGPIF